MNEHQIENGRVLALNQVFDFNFIIQTLEHV